jgi:hypothetical protein
MSGPFGPGGVSGTSASGAPYGYMAWESFKLKEGSNSTNSTNATYAGPAPLLVLHDSGANVRASPGWAPGYGTRSCTLRSCADMGHAFGYGTSGDASSSSRGIRRSVYGCGVDEGESAEWNECDKCAVCGTSEAIVHVVCFGCEHTKGSSGWTVCSHIDGKFLKYILGFSAIEANPWDYRHL